MLDSNEHNEYLVDAAESLLKFVVLRVLESERRPLQQTEINRKTGILKMERAKKTERSKDWITHYILKILESEKKVEQKKERGPWEIKNENKKMEIQKNKS